MADNGIVAVFGSMNMDLSVAAVSATKALGKIDPSLSVDSGSQFPPEDSTGKRDPFWTPILDCAFQKLAK